MIAIEEIKGIGPKTTNLLKKIGINDISSLIGYYPFRYNFIRKDNIDNINQDEKITIDGMVENVPNVYYINRRLDKMSFRVNAQNKIISVVIFNRGFLKKDIKPGVSVILIGKYDKKHNTIVANEIRFGTLSDQTIIEPVYHTTYGISSKQIEKTIGKVIDKVSMTDYIPDYLNEKYKFFDKKNSLFNIHQPDDEGLLKKAITRLKYEELFMFMLKINYLKNNKKNKLGLKRAVDYSLVSEFISKLPFELTKDQLNSVKDIFNDLNSDNQMNRLLQGDVGSGKTIVAIISIYINYLSGYQSALMAPTEILAIQHFNNISKLFNSYGIKTELLTGKLKASERKIINAKLSKGEIDLIIGTHVLFSDDVIYNNLGLVITDEQHRFGVNQRASLKNKGVMPDILYMSATPIPRTYALTLYGDMDVSNIKTMPKGRKEIITYVKKESDMKEILHLMFNELKDRKQIYVIVPLIEESDKIDLENVSFVAEKMARAFGKLFNIGVMHGKLDNAEKEDIMDRFKKNEIQILVSTTVIEVGVDVPNATMMVIFDSFRFGLSTLHQLRGRVGRSDLQSYCILISNKDTERLNILEQTNDGFKISEEDFLLRGSGDLFGQKQSGDMVLGLADIKKDYKMLLTAKKDSEEFIDKKYYDDNYIHIRGVVSDAINLD